ncbi:MAG TPA: 4-hydroxy-tetrahydrodipicolinate reductase [Rhizomicrobium sp.]|nr:4-hydroxy-tetrahydrodipicolinate reductase [Rhizomicrobium sp.]
MSGIRVVVAGPNGRMGLALARAISADKTFTLAGTLGSASNADEAASLLAKADALIDFTTPAASMGFAAQCAKARVAHIIGTTGFSKDDEAKIAADSQQTAIVKSGNMSLSVNVLAALVKQAAKALPDFDIEILEMHHRHKVDAPSGTALLLGEAAAKARGTALNARSETGARKDGTIGFVSVRGGTVVGEHEVIFAGPHERLVLGHVAEDRSIFASGALAAAKWAQGKSPGLYAMADVLGL